MRRLYSRFTGGWPGTGLLVLRVVVGCALVLRGSWRLAGDVQRSMAVLAALLVAAGILLILGLWTQISGTAVAFIETLKMFTMPGDKWAWLFLGTIGAAVAMLGPGLWSIDAYIYGWRRVEAPQKSGPPRINGPQR